LDVIAINKTMRVDLNNENKGAKYAKLKALRWEKKVD